MLRLSASVSSVNVRAVYEGENWTEAREAISASLDQMSLPPGYSWSFGERIQRQDEQTQQMLVNYLLALLLVYIVMASQFESLAHLFAFWGAAWCLWAPDGPFILMRTNWSLDIDGDRGQKRHRSH